MPSNITNVDLRSYTRDEIVSDEDTLDTARRRAAEYLDNATGRQFAVAGDTATARVYRPGSPAASHLWIHDCVEITSVVEDGSTLTALSDYIAEPLNGLTAVGEARPYDRLQRVDRYWYFDGPTPTVTVTARWGWASIPDMRLAAEVIVAKSYLDNRDVKFGLVGAAEFGGIAEREAKIVREFITQYRSHAAWGVA